MKDAQDSLRRHREARKAKEKASEHIQSPIVSAGPPKHIGLLSKAKLAKQAFTLYKTATSPNMKLSGSWKSSLFASGGLATALFNITAMLLDGDPTTAPDWGVYLPLIFASAVGLFTRDNDKSSQDVGLRPAVKP